MSNTNRSKGHNFERDVAILFRNAGYQSSKTTRATSKILDDCGIDLIGTPYIIQCKAGYDKKNFKYDEEKQYTYDKLVKLIGEKNANIIIEKYPYILIRKFNVGRGKRRTKDSITVTINLEDFMKLISKTNTEEDEVIDIVS